MTFAITTPSLVGAQAIADTSTTAYHPLGTRADAYDPTYGAAEFIYLLGANSTVVGSLVKYNATTWQTTLLANTANQDVPVAVAMSANVASSYGWYMIYGQAVVKKTAVTVNPQVPVYISGTAGRVKVVASGGLQIVGARTANLATVTSTTSTVVLTINRPFAQGSTS